MHAITLLLFTLIAFATSTTPALHARQAFDPNNTTFVCIFPTSDTNWGGETQNLCQVAGVCSPQLPDGLSAYVSSVGPTDGQTCFLYSGANCTGTRSAPIVSPGYADLSAIGFAKQAISWQCWKMCGYQIVNESMTSSLASISTTFMRSGTKSAGGSDRVDVEVTTTLQRATSITTTLSGSQPPVNTTTQTQVSSISTTLSTTAVMPSSASSISTTLAPTGSTSSVSSTVGSDIPGFSMSTSTLTLTHTFADGSTTVLTTAMIDPVPTVPSAPQQP